MDMATDQELYFLKERVRELERKSLTEYEINDIKTKIEWLWKWANERDGIQETR